MQALVHLPALRVLTLESMEVRGDAFSLLAQLPGLKEMAMASCYIIDASCLQALPSLTQLRELTLDALDCPKIQVCVLSLFTCKPRGCRFNLSV